MPKIVVPKPSKQPKQVFLGGGSEPPKFMPSYYEWLFQKGKSIHLAVQTVTAAFTIYTVPDDHILYLISYYLQGDLRTDPLMVVTFSLWTTNLPQTSYAAQLIRFSLSKVDMSDRVIINCSLPLKIESKEQIQIGASTVDGVAWGGFAGFLVQKKDIPSF